MNNVPKWGLEFDCAALSCGSSTCGVLLRCLVTEGGVVAGGSQSAAGAAADGNNNTILRRTHRETSLSVAGLCGFLQNLLCRLYQGISVL